MTQQLNHHASSTGQGFTEGDWLDLHFEAARFEYHAQLRAVGIQPGWHVLDAACGSGSFLPWLAELVGAEGRVAELDVASDNVSLVEQRMAREQLPCSVEARVGTVLALPYPDDAFDAVWFANTTQYLTDEELETALAELRRVVRPGGLVAVKEADGTLIRVLPAPPGTMLRSIQASANSGSVQAAGTLRSPVLPGWLRRAGLADVWSRSTLVERSAPLDPLPRRFWHGFLTYAAAHAADLDLPVTDQAFWEQLHHPAGLDRFLDDQDCSLIDANILTVGTVPVNSVGAA